MRGDAGALERALANLVQNAHAHGPSGGRSLCRSGRTETSLGSPSPTRAPGLASRGGNASHSSASGAAARDRPGSGSRPRDRAGDRGAARRPRLRRGLALHDRAPGSQNLSSSARYNERSNRRKDRHEVFPHALDHTTRRTFARSSLRSSQRGSAALAVAACGGGGPTPPAKPLAQAIHDALAGREPDGITADITFTNKLFPSGALTGVAGSALLSGANGRLWATNDGRGRLELQSNAGDVQIVWNADEVTAYDASSNTVYRFTLPSGSSTSSPDRARGHAAAALRDHDPSSPSSRTHATVSDAQPDNVGSAARLHRHDLAEARRRPARLRAARVRRGTRRAAADRDLRAGQLDAGARARGHEHRVRRRRSASDVDVSPPAGAKIVDLGSAHDGSDWLDGQRADAVDGPRRGAGRCRLPGHCARHARRPAAQRRRPRRGRVRARRLRARPRRDRSHRAQGRFGRDGRDVEQPAVGLAQRRHGARARDAARHRARVAAGTAQLSCSRVRFRRPPPSRQPAS